MSNNEISGTESSSTATSREQQGRKFNFKRPQAKQEGEPSEFKSMVLQHWSRWVEDYERENLTAMQALAREHPTVWRATPRTAPLSSQPFDQVERRAYSTGHLQTYMGAQASASHTPSTSANTGPSNYVKRESNMNQAPRKKFTTSSWRDSTSASTNQKQHHNQQQPYQNQQDSSNTEESIEWATEEGGIGMFEADGSFKFISEASMLQTGVKSPLAKSALFGEPEPEVTITQPQTAIQPIVDPATDQWMYKDPKGNVQGPFSSAQMFDWYSRRFFPDTLPLTKKGNMTDNFESLAVWKVRCEGKSPFECVIYPTVGAPGFSAPILAPVSSPIIQFGSLSPEHDPIVNVPVMKQQPSFGRILTIDEPEPVVLKQPVREPEPEPEDEVEQQRKFLEGLMLKKSAKKPVQEPKIESVLAEQAAVLQTKYSAPESSGWSTAHEGSSSGWNTAPKESSSGWSTAPKETSSGWNTAPKQVEEPVKPASPAWNIPKNDQPAVSLSQIQKEQKESKPERPKEPVKPKSFADLLSSTVTTPNVSPVVVAPTSPPVQKPVAANKTLPHTQQYMNSVKQPEQQQSKQADLSLWVQEKLQRVPVDGHLMASLLADCKTAEEAAVLLRDNLLMEYGSDVELRMFSREYLKRRFSGKLPVHVTDMVMHAGKDDRERREEGEFSVVTRKKK